MIEYLHDAIRATAGQDICVCAKITDDDGELITNVCSLMLHDDDNMLVSAPGFLDEEGVWEFTIPAEATANLSGRFWYCICCDNTNLCFKQPIYLV